MPEIKPICDLFISCGKKLPHFVFVLFWLVAVASPSTLEELKAAIDEAVDLGMPKADLKPYLEKRNHWDDIIRARKKLHDALEADPSQRLALLEAAIKDAKAVGLSESAEYKKAQQAIEDAAHLAAAQTALEVPPFLCVRVFNGLLELPVAGASCLCVVPVNSGLPFICSPSDGCAVCHSV